MDHSMYDDLRGIESELQLLYQRCKADGEYGVAASMQTLRYALNRRLGEYELEHRAENQVQLSLIARAAGRRHDYSGDAA
jgi:hypothetical protein